MQKKQKHLLECCEYWEQGTCLIHDTLMGQKNAFTGGCDGVTSADPTEKNMFDPNLNDRSSRKESYYPNTFTQCTAAGPVLSVKTFYSRNVWTENHLLFKNVSRGNIFTHAFRF